MPSQPLVSVITPLFNAEPYIKACMDSVAGQTFENWEQIIVDDGSTDNGAAQVSERAARDPRLTLVRRTSNGGASVARNAAFRLMRGRYVAFLDADDVWLPHKLSLQINQLQNSDAVMVFSPYEKITALGNRTGRIVQVPDDLDYSGLLRGCWIACLTAMIDRERVGTIEMPYRRRSQDYALWLSLLRAGGHAQSSGEVTALYRAHGKGLSRNVTGRITSLWDIYRQQEGLGRRLSAYLIGSHLAGALYRRTQ
ncbi:glycosyltransferase family 2 protein [Thioalkalivibrio sp. AKL10]|uniref:glycosyltransferase family 2 protein n=1 Tax=Thioalkalivibrio sp. AKL10 TaxID=1158158 RepID=UPI002101206C|nr:glycosyltransferase family 2 protein [Thioalkalivibrio sp. AKL10]